MNLTLGWGIAVILMCMWTFNGIMTSILYMVQKPIWVFQYWFFPLNNCLFKVKFIYSVQKKNKPQNNDLIVLCFTRAFCRKCLSKINWTNMLLVLLRPVLPLFQAAWFVLIPGIQNDSTYQDSGQQTTTQRWPPNKNEMVPYQITNRICYVLLGFNALLMRQRERAGHVALTVEVLARAASTNPSLRTLPHINTTKWPGRVHSIRLSHEDQ